MTAARPQRILRYLRACVEAEHAATELVAVDAAPAGTEPALLLERGAVPLGEAESELAPSNRARRWAEARRTAGTAGTAEALWVGWPVVRGHRRVGGRRTEVVAGLVIGQATLIGAVPPRHAGDPGRGPVLVPRGQSVELGDEALELLGYPADERHLLRRDFDRALNRGRGDTFAAAARFVNARGITNAGYDPRDLGPLDQAKPLSNTAVAWVGQAGDAAATRWVLADLDELGASAGTEPAPPIAALLAESAGATAGAAAQGEPPPLEPVPGIAPLDIHQEAAIAAALHRPLSVVTVPAGLARADLIANTVAAALIREERVLVASTNERALDLVHERLATANVYATPVRAGLDAHRTSVADAVSSAVRATIDPNRAERYPTWWAVRADIEGPYQSLARRRELTWRLEQITRERTEVEGRLPAGVKAEGSSLALAAAIGPARARAAEWQAAPRSRPWHKPRARAAERALDQALESVFSALDGPVGELARLRLGAGDPLAALDLATTVLAVLEATEKMSALVAQLSKLPDEATLDERIEASYPVRRVSSAQLHEDRWADLLDAGPRLRSAAQLYRAGLAGPAPPPRAADDPESATEAAAAGEGTSPLRGSADVEEATRAELLKLVPDVLTMLPVWLVTTASVGQWFPLAELFDLVIVDDAGQGDIASALPALARARRAMVIGDPHQLGPVTHVTTDLDAQLAGEHDLSEDDHRRFSPRRGSLLSLAARAAGAPPALLPAVADVDPELVALVGGQWYGGKLQARNGGRLLPGPALRWIDHRGSFDVGRGGRSGRNASEALAVVDEIVAQLDELRSIEHDEIAQHEIALSKIEQDERESHDATNSAAGDETVDGDPHPEGAGEAAAAAGAAAAHREDLGVSELDLRAPVVRSIGVVTPLDAQREALSDLLLERFGRTITVDTPDTFQGDERDVVIVSLVIGEDTRRELVELVADDARLNVALSRARSRLVIVGDREVAAASGTRLADIVEAVETVQT